MPTALGELGFIEGQKDLRVIEGTFRLEEDDWLLYAMLCDPIFLAELLFEDPLNHTHGGCYTVYDYQYPLFRPPPGYAAFPCARSTGKALPDDELVLGAGGWKAMADVEVGSFVIGADGRPTEVTEVHPQGERPIWELRFSDGARVECDDEHLWEVTNDTWISRSDKNDGAYEVRRTADLVASLSGTPHSMGGEKQRWRLRLVEPVRFFSTRELPLDPYLLGLLLGDGNLTRPSMVRYASVDDELVDSFRSMLDPTEELAHDDGCNYRLRRRSRIGSGRSAPPLLTTLREMGLMEHGAHEKFIPGDYLVASVHDRLALLQGLVDTDGHVLPASGGVDYSTASEALAAGIRQLVLSLGGRCTSVARATPGRLSFRLHFKLPSGMKSARLLRKQVSVERVRDTMTRSLVGARYVGSKSATCIKVAAADGLFVVKDFVVTHNTESIKARSCSHAFKRMGEDMLLTAPELIHLEALTQHIEQRITDVRLLREFLKRDAQKTGFTHKPFMVEFSDGTRIIGRIPRLTGTGVKGMHEPDLIMDESQDYPPKGYTEVHETVMKDHVDSTGTADFTYHLYGVHSGAAGGRFESLAESGEFKVTAITALMRPGWNKAEKEAASAMYGGTHGPDYRRNILGEPGTALSQFFVTSRLMACLDQDSESKYNTSEFKDIHLMAEDVDKMLGPKADLSPLLDLPHDIGPLVYAGMDVGLVNDPTVITLFCVQRDKDKRARLKLVRMLHLWRFRERQIREACYRIDMTYGKTLQAFGQDITGLGLPMFQAMEDDEACPEHLRQISRGYVFNAKVPVGVEAEYVSQVGGKMVDQYGNIVRIERDKWTGKDRYISEMTMIEASTRYLRNFVDQTYLMLPFHQGLVKDMQGETEQRVRAMGSPHLRKKPSAFHMLDSMRAMAMAYMAEQVEQTVLQPAAQPVLDMAVATAPGEGGGMEIHGSR